MSAAPSAARLHGSFAKMIACAHFAVMANPLSAEDDSPHGRGIFQRAQPIGDVSLFIQRGATLTSLLLLSSFTEKAQRESPCWNINIMEEKHLFRAIWREERRIIDPQPWTLFACRTASDRRRCAATSPVLWENKTAKRFPGWCASKRALAKEESQGRNSLKVAHCVKSQAHLRAGRELNSLRVDERFGRRWARREKMKKREAGRDSAVLLDD